MAYEIRIAPAAERAIGKLSASVQVAVLDVLESSCTDDEPRRAALHSPPPFEKLVGDLSGAYCRRINIRHRQVYEVLEDEQVVKVLRMWAHYD